MQKSDRILRSQLVRVNPGLGENHPRFKPAETGVFFLMFFGSGEPTTSVKNHVQPLQWLEM